ncbi:VOC family protein [Streptomyces sp. NPDC054770]
MATAAGGGFTLEFQVTDVDARHERLPARGVEILKPPTTQPWGQVAVRFTWGARSSSGPLRRCGSGVGRVPAALPR